MEGEDANKQELESRIQSLKPELLVFNGHGTETKILGHDGEELVVEGENEEILSGAIVYSRVCGAAASLGEEAVENGTKAFIGYKGSFFFLNDTRSSARPDDDPIAQHIMAPSNEVPLSLLDGSTAREAFEKSQRRWEEERAKVKENYDPENQWLLGALRRNRANQRLIGEDDAQVN